MPATKVYSMKPHWDIDAYFVDPVDGPTFDPKHPRTYPGDEVQVVETISGTEAVKRYGKTLDGVLYAVSGNNGKLDSMRIILLERTGRTSVEVLEENI